MEVILKKGNVNQIKGQVNNQEKSTFGLEARMDESSEVVNI